MKLGSTDMSTSHWCAIVALWFAPGTREVHGTAQSAPCTYSFQSQILPTGYKVTPEILLGTEYGIVERHCNGSLGDHTCRTPYMPDMKSPVYEVICDVHRVLLHVSAGTRMPCAGVCTRHDKRDEVNL